MTADLRPIYFAEARARLVGNRLAVYMALTEAGPSTPKELAARMGWDVTSVRPRLTEMSPGHAEKYGSIPAVNTTGIRRNGEHEWRALTAAETAQIKAEREEVTVAREQSLFKTTAETFTAGGYVGKQLNLI